MPDFHHCHFDATCRAVFLSLSHFDTACMAFAPVAAEKSLTGHAIWDSSAARSE